ncbi:prolipoprotein diacylglyceryl transferase [Nocardioides sp. CPCC 205120]|uniref:prolipoprotein diacylglyceryl transferase n=1 Tax=Nocardioides sp. CPCC 205120 TaxID=3406462 RepID=UPI003B514AF4
MLTALDAFPALVHAIPSPDQGVWHLGPLPLRGYALCIILGVVAAVMIGERRWVARGGQYGDVQDIAVPAVLLGIVGARIYHVATDWELYFGEGREPIRALYLWEGGLGIWGAIALGALGAWIGARRKGIRFLPLVDALAPGLLVAQAIGRWGNWFNQELFGRPTDLPWGLSIDLENRPTGYTQFETFHPTYLYEFLWNLAAFALIVWLDRRYRLGGGRVVALYVATYTVGRAFTESLRIDEVQLDDVLGLRLNVWTSIVLFTAAVVYLLVTRGRTREDDVYVEGRRPEATDAGTDAGTDEVDPDAAPGAAADARAGRSGTTSTTQDTEGGAPAPPRRRRFGSRG